MFNAVWDLLEFWLRLYYVLSFYVLG